MNCTYLPKNYDKMPGLLQLVKLMNKFDLDTFKICEMLDFVDGLDVESYVKLYAAAINMRESEPDCGIVSPIKLKSKEKGKDKRQFVNDGELFGMEAWVTEGNK